MSIADSLVMESALGTRMTVEMEEEGASHSPGDFVKGFVCSGFLYL